LISIVARGVIACKQARREKRHISSSRTSERDIRCANLHIGGNCPGINASSRSRARTTTPAFGSCGPQLVSVESPPIGTARLTSLVALQFRHFGQAPALETPAVEKKTLLAEQMVSVGRTRIDRREETQPGNWRSGVCCTCVEFSFMISPICCSIVLGVAVGWARTPRTRTRGIKRSPATGRAIDDRQRPRATGLSLQGVATVDKRQGRAATWTISMLRVTPRSPGSKKQYLTSVVMTVAPWCVGPVPSKRPRMGDFLDRGLYHANRRSLSATGTTPCGDSRMPACRLNRFVRMEM